METEAEPTDASALDLSELVTVVSKEKQKPLNIKSLRVLMDSKLKGPDVVIQDVLSVGVNLLFALQNRGKTWMALQIARCVTSGEDFLGKKVGKKGRVIYYCLEDGEANLKQRAELQWQLKGNPGDCYYSDVLSSPNRGGWDELERAIQEYEPVLVVIDNLMVFLGSKSINTNSFSEMSEYMTRFRNLSKEYGVCFLLVHHGKKPSVGLSDSGPESAIGSTAISANCATRIQIHSPEGRHVLESWSKIFKNQKLSMRFNPETYTWEKV